MKGVQLGAVVGAELQEELEGSDSFFLFPQEGGGVWISRLFSLLCLRFLLTLVCLFQ